MSVVATQYLFDAVSKATSGKASYRECMIYLVILAAAIFGQQIINGVQNFLGGLDIAKYSFSVWEGISGVFQKYQRYKMTLRENVTISDMTMEVDENKIKSVLEEAGFEKDNVGLDDMLSPEFNGLDISGGQWQRVAIARGLYRVNGFIVLDEPTSAIDPIEETKIYKKFAELAKGKCALVVTHRIGSAKLADRIIVMDAGKVVDMGTHKELIARPGQYAKMWEAQAQWYERD